MPLSQKTKDNIFSAVVFLAMLAGMAAKALYDHYTRDAPLELKSFIIPLIVSPLVYGSVFAVANGSENKVIMLIFGFQNGFFWQDIFGQVKAPTVQPTVTPPP